MSIPKLRRLPVTKEDLTEINLSIPPELIYYAYEYQFDADDCWLLKLGLIENEIAYVEDGWLYYFAQSQPYRFSFKMRLAENAQGATVTELWAGPRLDSDFILGGTTE